MDVRTATLTRWLEDYRGLIYKVVMIYADNLDEQEDLFQDIAVALWRSCDQFEGRSRETTWVYRVALNTAIDRRRRDGRRPQTTSLRADHHWVSLPDPDEEQSWLYASIRSLDLVDRSLVLLYLDGNSYADIGEILGIRAANVGVKINRVKAKLKKKLEEERTHE